MTFSWSLSRGQTSAAALFLAVLGLTGCATVEVDDPTGSRLSQPAAADPNKPRQAEEASDIAIVGQVVAHGLLDLPAVSGATIPPMVRFDGVTSIVKGANGPVPIDTEPYTTLFRDRLLLLTRLKLRFVEHTLPMYAGAPKKGKKHADDSPAPTPSGAADYRLLAELRGKYESDFFFIQVQFTDIHSSEVLFDGLYRIRKEGYGYAPNEPVVNAAPPQSIDDPSVRPEPSHDATAPPQTDPSMQPTTGTTSTPLY